MSFTSRFSMQGTLAIQYTSGPSVKVSEVEEYAERVLASLGIAPDYYRITGVTMDHSTYSPAKYEAQVEFNMVGNFKEE